MKPNIETLSSLPSGADLSALEGLLRDAVEGGASVGFMLPVRAAEVTAFWQDTFAEVAAGKRLVLAVRAGGSIVGSVQLELAGRPNSRHRAEVQKLLVLRAHRRQGLGAALLQGAEAMAQRHGRWLLVLDTSSSGNALGLYHRCGYTRAGLIPQYARDPDGPLIDTVVYYKTLAHAEPINGRRHAAEPGACGDVGSLPSRGQPHQP
jgi:acetyltransferase